MKEKVLVYITCKSHILMIRHSEHPEVGLQVPGGTIEPEESPDFAAIREAKEETGLNNFRLVRKLGVWKFDMRPFAEEVHRRHYYHFEIEDEDISRKWLHFEHHPAQGNSKDPIRFELFWKPLAGNDLGLVAGHGEFLGSLNNEDHFIHVRHHTKNLELEIKNYRFKRISKINAVLSKISPKWTKSSTLVPRKALGFAIFEHFYHQILHAVRRNNTHDINLLLKHWSNRELQLFLNSEPFLVVFAKSCNQVWDPQFDSPLYLVPISQVEKVHEQEVYKKIHAVIEQLRDGGFGDFLDPWLGAIIISGQPRPASETGNNALLALGGSICVDDTEHHARMAALILQEASHVWLNEALSALGESLPQDIKYASPWKNIEQPAYGLLHTAWAHSQLIQWFQFVCNNPDVSDFERAHGLERLKVEIPTMKSALPEISDVCNLLKDPRLKGLMLDEINKSIQTARPIDE